MYQETGTLTPTPPFDFDKSLQFLGIFGPTKYEQTIASHSLTKATCIDGQTVVFQLTSTGTTEEPRLEYTLFSAQPITEATKDTVVERVNFFLSLDDDLEPFYRIGREDEDFTPIIEHFYGYHQVKFLTPFEIACWAVLTQRNPLSLAQKTKQKLVENFGGRLEVHRTVYWAFPEPAQLATVDPKELATVIGNERRAEYLSAIALAFHSVDEQFLRTANYDEVEAWLRKIKGIGEWSASYILLRGLGRMERVPITEKRLFEAASKVYGQGAVMTGEAIQRIADRYGSCQGYWAHYLRVGT